MNALVIILIIIAVAAAVVFGVGGFFVGNLTRKKSTENTIGSAQQEANRILSEANKSAEAAKKEPCCKAERTFKSCGKVPSKS